MRKQITRGMLSVLFAASLLCVFKGAYAQEDQPKPEVKDVKVAAAPRPTQTMPASAYRFEYVVRELEDGKQINSRRYMLSGKSREWARLRVGNRLPIMSGQSLSSYHDVGIKFDCRIDEGEDGILLYTGFDSTGVVLGASGGSAAAPVLRQVSTQGDSLVTIGKPTVIAVLDDVTTNRRYEIEVTVTKVK